MTRFAVLLPPSSSSSSFFLKMWFYIWPAFHRTNLFVLFWVYVLTALILFCCNWSFRITRQFIKWSMFVISFSFSSTFCHHLPVVISIRFVFILRLLQSFQLDSQFICWIVVFSSNWFVFGCMCVCVVLIYACLALDFTQSVFCGVCSISLVHASGTMYFVTIKSQWKFSFLFVIFGNDPSNDVINDPRLFVACTDIRNYAIWIYTVNISVCLCVSLLFDFVLELTTKCRNKTI